MTVAEPNEARRRAARRTGATDLLTDGREASADSYDVAFDCVGLCATLGDAVAAVRACGRVVLAGMSSEPMKLPSYAPMMKELTLRHAVASRPDEFREVIAALASGRINPAVLVGPSFGLDEIMAGFAEARSGRHAGRTSIGF